MYKIILQKNLPFIQNGYYSFLNLKSTKIFKIFLFPKKKLDLKKKFSKSIYKFCKTNNNLTPIQSELKRIKAIYFLINLSQQKTLIFQYYNLTYNLFSNLNILSNNLNSHLFGIELLLFNKCESLRIVGSKLLKNFLINHGLYNTLIFLQIRMNHKNKNIRMITSIALSIIKQFKDFNILNPFLRCLYIFKKKWRIRYSICKTIQNLIKNCKTLSSYQKEEFMFLAERCLNNYKDIIKINGIKIFQFLTVKIKNDSIYLPCLISPIFDGLRRNKKNFFLIYLKAAKIFLKNYILKIPFLLLIELIDIILRFNKKKNEFNLCSIKTLSLCFKKKFYNKNYLKNILFFSITSVLKYIIQFSYNRKTHTRLNVLISFSKKNIIKKVLFFILFKLFNKNIYFFNNILRLIRGLLLKYHKKKKISFTLISSIFIRVLSSIDDFFLKIIISTFITLKLCHRILEIIVINFPTFSNYFLLELSKTLKCELKNQKSIFRKQAVLTIKIISDNLNLSGKLFFIYEFSVILFENLNELEPYILSENILSINLLLKTLNLDEYIPPVESLILEFVSILKNRKKIILRYLTKSIWHILNKNFIFLSKSQLANISIQLISVAKNFDLTIKKYSICCIYKIAKIIGPIDVITIIVNEYNINNKNYYISHSTLFTLFLEMFGCQVVSQIFSYFFNKIILKRDLFGIKNLMYITWYLPYEKIKYFFNLILILLKKNFEQYKKDKPNSIYILVGLFVKKSKNKASNIDLNKILLNIWPSIFKIDKPTFKFVFFAIQKMCTSIECIHFKLFLSQGIFHPNCQIRKIYWYIYFNVKINLTYLVMICVNKRVKTI